MTKSRELTEERLEDELDDLNQEGIDLPSRIQARWRKSDGPRKMPKEREDARAKPHRTRRHSE